MTPKQLVFGSGTRYSRAQIEMETKAFRFSSRVTCDSSLNLLESSQHSIYLVYSYTVTNNCSMSTSFSGITQFGLHCEALP